MARVAVIGAGAMGLAAAYHAAGAGHDVEVFEADTVAGGMAGHFDFDGVSLERFYHFVCKADAPTGMAKAAKARNFESCLMSTLYAIKARSVTDSVLNR